LATSSPTGKNDITSASHESEFLNTEQGWSTGTLSEADMARINNWYIDTHGQENLDLVKFVQFMTDLRPEAFKAYRRDVPSRGHGGNGSRLSGRLPCSRLLT
jgi:hypothetical protein